MTKRTTFEDFKIKALQDKEVRAEYDVLKTEFTLLEKFIKARKQAHYSQLELANKLNLQQPSIGRLEKSGYATTSVSTLAKVANALGYSIKIS
jgi:DNA-binding XRE family transcriptional regulator